MRTEIRKIGEKELAAAVAFANRQFGLDFYRLQPKLYRCNGSGASYGCYVEDSLAGMLSVYPCECKGLRCLSVGTVCTAPEFRGRGIMSRLFGYLEEAVFPDYDLLTLAGKRERYERFGFAKALCFPEYQLSRKGDDRDIIAMAKAGDEAVVAIFFIRSGKLLGRDHFHMTGIGDSEKQEIITDFIKQFYVGTPFIPKEILTQEEVLSAAERRNSFLCRLQDRGGFDRGVRRLAAADGCGSGAGPPVAAGDGAPVGAV
mgnify:CR=1 FL=1